MIICITGLAGSGKTTIANYIEERLKTLNYTVFHFTSDWIAQKIFADKYANLDTLDVDYTSEELDCIYNTLFLLFEQILIANPKAIIITDGMYRRTSYRLILKLIAEQLQTKFVLMKVDTPIPIAKLRLKKRKELTGFGQWADPKSYEEPQFENVRKIENKLDLKRLKVTVTKLLIELNLSNYKI